MNEFSPAAFFDLSPPLEPLFADLEYAWDAVGALPGFIEAVINPGVAGTVEEGAWIEPDRVEVAEGAVIQRGAIVHGPTVIGRGTEIRSGAFIRGHVWTGEGCIIGHAAEVRQVLLMNGSSLPHLNCFFTSIVGNHVRIGGATHTANYQLTEEEITIRIVDAEGNRRKFPTGQTKFGCVVGDGAVISGAVVLQSGTILGRECLVMPEVTVSGFVPPRWKVMPKYGGFRMRARPRLERRGNTKDH